VVLADAGYGKGVVDHQKTYFFEHQST
jgi:hypothetical protein